MLYEYLLISVVIACGYWGWFFIRRRPSGTPMFGAMLIGTALLAGLGVVGRRWAESPALGVAGAIGLGAGVCLLVVGPLLRAAARRLAAAERLGAAARLLDVAEVLAPGSGVAEEKAVLGAMREIRDGRIEQTVDALVAAKERAPAEARLAIDERIALLYLAAYRWRDAIAHAETHLFGAAPPSETAAGDDDLDDEAAAAPPTDGAAGAGAGSEAALPPAGPAPGSLRRALGIAPPVWVELLGAYGRTGDLDRAARMVARLEDVCAGRDDAAMWIHRARVMFLALAGRTPAVKALVEPRRSRHMSAAARTYWVAVAHEHEGDRAAATEAYERARTRTRGRPRELIDQALARLVGGGEPAQLSPLASEVVARIEAAPLPAPVVLPRAPRRWATWAMTGAVLGTAVAIAAVVGPSEDLGVLVRSGAMVRGLVADGEWWRLISCVFVHVGMVHVALNTICLFFLGRVTEELFGPARTLAIFGGSGLAGAFASYLAAPSALSAGASGAVLGLLGAVFVELTLHRDHYRAAWKRGLWGAVVVVAIGQVGTGFLYPVIDQWAHGAGLGAGVVLGAVLSPHVRWAAAGRHLGRALALMFAAFAIAAAVLVVRTSIADSIGGAPARRVINRVAFEVPASWTGVAAKVDPTELVVIEAQLHDVTDARAQLEGWVKHVALETRKAGAAKLGEAPAAIVPLPAGWQGAQLLASFEDGMESEQRFAVIAAARVVGGKIVVVSIVAPLSIVRAMPAVFEAVLASAAPA